MHLTPEQIKITSEHVGQDEESNSRALPFWNSLRMDKHWLASGTASCIWPEHTV